MAKQWRQLLVLIGLLICMAVNASHTRTAAVENFVESATKQDEKKQIEEQEDDRFKLEGIYFQWVKEKTAVV